MPKRILIFSTEYFPRVGGAEIAVKEITDRLPDCEFDLITAKGQGGLADFERIGRINVHRTGLGSRFDKFLLPISGFLKARHLSKENNYAFAWSIMASYAGLAACAYKSAFKKKLVLTVQEGDDEEHLKRFVFGNEILYKALIRPVHRLAFRAADFITAISADLANRAKKSAARVEPVIVPNGVETELFSRPSSVFPDVRKLLGIKPDEKIVITVSRLAKKNGVEDLIRAFKIIASAKVSVKLVICGIGEEEKKLRKTAENLGLGERVVFAGLVKHGDLPGYLWASDCFARPSLSEGLGNVFLEAMAAGVPIVGTPVGGIPDFLTDGETGLFCEPGNPEDIAEKIINILSDRPLSEKLSSNGLKLVKEKFEWDQIAARMGEIFESV
jgi:glycosyltransferase involved in cell wall biosynthesis